MFNEIFSKVSDFSPDTIFDVLIMEKKGIESSFLVNLHTVRIHSKEALQDLIHYYHYDYGGNRIFNEGYLVPF